MDLDLIRRVYGKGATVYDAVFGPLLERGRKMAVEAANATGAKSVLEVGVGTGLSLPLYRPDIKVTGIDIPANKCWSSPASARLNSNSGFPRALVAPGAAV